MTQPSESMTRNVLIWMCVLIAANQLAFSANTPILAQYAESFGVSMTAIGFTFAIYGLARLLLNIPAGNTADRFGRKEALAIGGALSALSAVGCAIAPTYELFLAARFLGGAGAAFVLTGGQIVLADIALPHNRGRLMSIYQGVFLATAGLGAIPGGWLADHYGIASPFWASAIFCALVTVVALMFVPETREMGRAKTGSHSHQPATSFLQQLRILSRNEGLMLIGLIGLMAAFGRTGGVFNIIPLMAENDLHLTSTQIGFGLGMISIVSLVFVMPSGVLVDKLGRKPVLVPATLLSGAGFLLFMFASDYRSFLLACFIWSCAGGFAGGAPAAYAADMAPAGMNAAAMGLYRALMDVGYVAGPLALGFMGDTWSVDFALLVTATLIIGTAILFAIRAPESKPVTRVI
ncbi:MAG: MFS transporter [Thermomicrobiales bacterium]|nr:MFS transporter [Thermomicrobiales bacterium]